MKARVYYNLHKNMLSIQEKTAKDWRVVRHDSCVALRNVKFCVSESGRQRVLREKRKNVHAFIEGEIVPGEAVISADTPVSYNPYKGPFFYSEKGDVHEAYAVIIFDKKIFGSL